MFTDTETKYYMITYAFTRHSMGNIFKHAYGIDYTNKHPADWYYETMKKYHEGESYYIVNVIEISKEQYSKYKSDIFP